METTIHNISTTSGNSLIIITIAIASMLVFFMQGGFSFIEAGFTRTKNTVSVFMKNMIGFAVSFITYITTNQLFTANKNSINWLELSTEMNTDTIVFLLFNGTVAALISTIAAGAMTERTSFKSHIAASAVIAGFIYPVSASWILETSWLSNLRTPFYDLGGSATIQLTAGMIALAGALVLGTRNDKKHFRTKAIPGQNLAYSALGLFILWFGWMGLHLGMSMMKNANIAITLLNTNIAACSATMATMAVAWLKFGKPSFSLTINGTVAGLAAIGAGCNVVSPLGAMIIGTSSGVILVYAVGFIESKLRVDDPVGATSIHGICGAAGIILTGIFSTKGGLIYSHNTQLLTSELIGFAILTIYSFSCGIVLFTILKYTLKLRVEKRLEEEGLDIYEHGESAYN